MSSRRGVALILSLILIAVLVSTAGLLVVALLTGSTPTIAGNSTLVLRIGAPFSEVEPAEILQQFIDTTPTLRATIDTIHRAKTDARVKTLIIRPAGAGALWAQIQEVRAALEDFRTSGKRVIAFLEAGTAGEYYLATAADRIVLMPAGELDLTGLAYYEVFFRGALDKFGVYPDLLHIGDYKTASNTFVEKGFTPAHREMTRALNRDWYDELVRAVAKGRKLDDEAARKAINGGPYLADAALKAGLVDELAYEDQLNDADGVKGTQQVTGAQYIRASADAVPSAGAGRVALLYAVGTIASGASSFDSPTGQVLGSDTFNEWVRKVRIDPGIRAVVVRIDSPGGSAIASEVMWRELMLTREVKPVVVSMGDVAASGGYYIATPAHVIVAEPGTLTGSIGVVTGKFVVQGGLDKLGVASATVTEGPSADVNSPFRPFTADERARIAEQMRTTYDLFVKRVAEGRQQTRDRIDAVAQGRVWTGHQARGLGLVDELGGLDLAIQRAAERAKLDPAKGVTLVVYPAKRSLYDLVSRQLGGASTSTSTSTSAALETLFRRPEIRAVQSAVSMMQLFRRGEPLAILPNIFLN